MDLKRLGRYCSLRFPARLRPWKRRPTMYDLMDEWPNRHMCHHDRSSFWRSNNGATRGRMNKRATWSSGSEFDQELSEADQCTMKHTKTARRRRLRSKQGYYLAVMPNGQVLGVRDSSNPHIELEVIPVGADLVKIWGVESELYLMIDDAGLLRATDVDSAECVFEERMTDDFLSVYYSAMYCRKRWSVGLHSSIFKRNRTESAFLIEVIQRRKSISSVDSEDGRESH